MSALNPEKIKKLQKTPSNIRNVCIMAHVDHGKTTLADSLVASNGIISKRLAGKLRYMDSREDEQKRGITMKSSSIALYHSIDDNEYLINVIDSPGHVDFSSEVSTAVRLCDGTIIVIDVVEGVCPQTQVALQLAWKEKLKPVLVLNKIDRLILEVKLSPLDAYVHLNQILEQLNAIIGNLFKSDIMDQADENTAATDESELSSTSNWSSGLENSDDSELYFSPEKGNVVFGSAIDGWGFCINDFAGVIAAKYNFNITVLQKTLWGDYYFHSKSKRVLKGAQEKAKKPLFVQFILENVWEFYNIIIVQKQKEKYGNIAEKLNIKLLPRDLRSNDPRVILQTIFSKWLPLSTAVLNMVCYKCPGSNNLSEEKIDSLMRTKAQQFYNQPPETLSLKSSFLKCSSAVESPLVIFISKMFPIEKRFLPENRQVPISKEELKIKHEQAKVRLAMSQVTKSDDSSEPCEEIEKTEFRKNYEQEDDESIHSNNSEHVLIAFSRIYSGCITKGREVYVLGPKHDPYIALQKLKEGIEINPDSVLTDLNSDEHITKVCVGNLYMLMGRELELLDEVGAGNVFGIGGLEDHVLKTATLSSDIACPAFAELQVMATPILRVAVEPKNPSELQELVRGLKLLNQADACVQILVQETGEHVLVTAGEVHLQKCIDDLESLYAKVSVVVSEPIIPFRETIISRPIIDEVNEAIVYENSNPIIKTNREFKDGGEIVTYTPYNWCSIKMKAIPLPEELTKLLENNSELLKILYKYTSLKREYAAENNILLNSLSDLKISNFSTNLKVTVSDNLSSVGNNQQNMSEHTINAIVALKSKIALILKSSNDFWKTVSVENIWSFGPKNCGSNILFNLIPQYRERSIWVRPDMDSENLYLKYDSSFLNGFQLASLAGPLCEEPMMGVGFVVLDWNIDISILNTIPSCSYGSASGQIMHTIKECCRKSFQLQPQRLMAAMFSCNIQVNTEVLGKLYAVLSRRHGTVLHGDMTSGSAATFNVTATLPVAESFQFSQEIRKQTSGLANPQLVFSHWEVIDLDPFWIPSTDEEYLHFGEKADSENYARTYMNMVRRRKGLPVNEQIVEFAEKQRTLSKNK